MTQNTYPFALQTASDSRSWCEPQSLEEAVRLAKTVSDSSFCPTAFRGKAGDVLARLEGAGFKVVALRMRHLTVAEAEGFYHVHRERGFFSNLTAFMSSGPCIPMVLERDDAIAGLRRIMGATDPAKADEGTIRRDFASSIEANAIHGSDAEETARFEIGYFFPGIEIGA